MSHVDADVQAEPVTGVLSGSAGVLTPSVTIAASPVLATALVALSLVARRWRSPTR